MARPSKTAAIDYAATHDLIPGLLERAVCPPDKAFVLVKDKEKAGLRLRVTKAGGKHWQFETRVKGKLFTRALGEWPTVSIKEAREEAHRLRGMTDKGADPREIERQQQAEEEARREQEFALLELKRQQEQIQSVTVGEVWAAYLEERRPHWGERHYADHVKMASPGGEPVKRGVKLEPGKPRPVTVPGPVFPLLSLRLIDLSPDAVEAWATENGKTRPTYARLCWRCLKVFLNWCAEHPTYRDVMTASNPAATKRSREALGKANVKKDALLREQLPAWFMAVRQIQNPAISAALQCLVLTGARLNEILALRWDDVNTQWRGLTLRDKDESTGGVEGVRTIPLTPYIAHLLAGLPRRNEWVFASGRAASMNLKNIKRRVGYIEGQEFDAVVGGDGHISPPNQPHADACRVAGIEGLSLHGLRRSFKSLTEWLDIPAGVVAQIMGHKPSATAEKHYTVRPLDLLRVHHERIEAWILEQAGVQFDRASEPGKLRVVA